MTDPLHSNSNRTDSARSNDSRSQGALFGSPGRSVRARWSPYIVRGEAPSRPSGAVREIRMRHVHSPSRTRSHKLSPPYQGGRRSEATSSRRIHQMASPQISQAQRVHRARHATRDSREKHSRQALGHQRGGWPIVHNTYGASISVKAPLVSCQSCPRPLTDPSRCHHRPFRPVLVSDSLLLSDAIENRPTQFRSHTWTTNLSADVLEACEGSGGSIHRSPPVAPRD